MHYEEAKKPLPDEEFLSRIGEFNAIQYKAFNGLSGKCCTYQLIASANPELKERVIAFLADHSVGDLLYGDINSDGFDMDYWEFRFIFDDVNMNRRICGYGVTDASAPFLYNLVSILREQTDLIRNH